MPTLYLIDGHAQFYRAYHAIRSAMSSPVTREPTNLTYGFTSMLLKLLRDYTPDYLAVVIDAVGDRETFRSELYPEYKANRPETPEGFRPQVKRCLSLLEQMAIPVIAVEGVEADDVIATLARRLPESHADISIRIVSRDKDLAQLVGGRVELFDAYKEEVVTPADIFKTEGIGREHVVDILALMGDAVDNVPGVPGIGPKTAGKLVLEYGSIDNLYAHLGEIKGKRRENLEASRDQIDVSRRLVMLKDDLDVAFDLEAARFDPARLELEPILASFRELGFGRLQDDVARLARGGDGGDDSTPDAAAPDTSGDGFADSLFTAPETADPFADPPGDYEAIRDEETLRVFVERARSSGVVAVDTETDGVHPMVASLCGVSMSVAPGTAVYVPLRSPEPDRHLDAHRAVPLLRDLLEDESVLKIGHNLKFDVNVLRRSGVSLAGPRFDTMIASYVIDATRSSHRLSVLALAWLDHTCIPISAVIGTGKNQKGFDEVPLDKAIVYAAEDADVALRLFAPMRERLDETGLRTLFEDLEMPLVEVLAEMEHNGIRVDPDELDRQRERLQERIVTLRREILEDAPHPFNPDSPKQLAVALFNKPDADPPGLGIRPLKRGKTGPSTDVEVLEKLAADATIESPVPRLIVEYRQLTKLVSTYLVALKEAIHPETRRVHASFNQTVAATGRLSSSDPNLQNIPIRTEVGREIRRAFIARDGYVLLSADYSQIELRLLAHLSEDPALIEAFHAGADIHTVVAAEVFGVATKEVTGEMRNTAKMVNFGIVYGITPYGLARRLGGDVTTADAGKIIDDYKRRFGRIDVFLDNCIQRAIVDGYVETMLGRRRSIPQVLARNPQQRGLGERMAINSVVQGSAADLIKLAMIELHRTLPATSPDARLVLQIHDELVYETPRETVEAVAAIVTDRMEHAMELSVPLVVETAWGETWMK